MCGIVREESFKLEVDVKKAKSSSKTYVAANRRGNARSSKKKNARVIYGAKLRQEAFKQARTAEETVALQTLSPNHNLGELPATTQPATPFETLKSLLRFLLRNL